MVSVPGMENVGSYIFPYLGQIMYWTGIIIGSGIMIGVLYAIYYYLQFNIKATVFPLYGSGTDGIFSFGKPKSNRIKWIEKRTAWKSMFPLFNKKVHEPFDDEYMYPGKRVFIFELGDRWIPGRININKSENEIRTEINPVPYSVRAWEALQYQKNAAEFAEHNFWEDNKYFIMGVVSVLICCILCGVTIWLTYKFSVGGVDSAARLTDALKNFGTIQGR